MVVQTTYIAALSSELHTRRYGAYYYYSLYPVVGGMAV